MALSLGKSVSEIQTTISQRELNLWSRYRHKYGPLNPVRMYDQGLALVASQINNAHGGKAKATDFMPYGKDPEPDFEESHLIAALISTGKARMGR